MHAATAPLTIAPDELEAWTRAILGHAGASKSAAAETAAALVDANLRGLDSHGVEFLHFYLPKLRSGATQGQAHPDVAVELPALAVVDGHDALGPYVAAFAIDLACDKAEQGGAAVVGVRNSSHFGAASVYSERAARRGCIGISMTNSDPGMAPEGALAPVLGTNPVAIAAPPGTSPVTPSLDMATSVVAFSRVIQAARAGTPIPPEWAIGPDGRPTQDPDQALLNAVVPFGGHKGFALAFMIDVLAGCLTGGLTSQDIVEGPDIQRPQGTSHLFVAIHLGSAGDTARYAESLDRLIETVHDAPRASWAVDPMIPGEPEHDAAVARRNGIPLSPESAGLLRALGEEYRLPFPH